MKKTIICLILCFLMLSCGSSFKSFYNNHKSDLGATSFQVPKFMKAIVGSISPEINQAIGNISDFKFIKFENINSFKRQTLIDEMSAVTKHHYVDVFRKNEVDRTQIISVKEKDVVVTDVIIFNSTEQVTTAYYLQGHFDAGKIRSLANEEGIDSFTEGLMKSYGNNKGASTNQEN